jgi:hypothetical protein
VVRVAVCRSGTFVILVYGTDPNRGEACVLNVVKVIPDGVPGPTAPAQNEKDLNEGRKRRSTTSGPRVCKRLGLHQLEVHNGP